jgi:molecular chaperone GrpE
MDFNEQNQTGANVKKGPVTRLVERIGELENLAQGLRNDYLRSLADFDNYRRRMERDIEIRQRASLEALLSDLLPVLDNFDRALCANSDNAEGLKKGIELIYKDLCAVLAKYGLKGYSCLGQVFDPARAEALGFVECEEGDANRVLEEFAKGYECFGRVIRPARVKVGRAGAGLEKEIGQKQE